MIEAWVLIVALGWPHWREESRWPMPSHEACQQEVARRWGAAGTRNNITYLCEPAGSQEPRRRRST